MRCPVCLDTELVEHIRDSIEVDHCPRCRGMWLDRGELDKLLDLAEARSPEHRITTPEPPRAPPTLAHDRREHSNDRDRWDDRDPRSSRRRRRKGAFAELLEDVFEAFD
jgi:uncharacterized protein